MVYLGYLTSLPLGTWPVARNISIVFSWIESHSWEVWSRCMQTVKLVTLLDNELWKRLWVMQFSCKLCSLCDVSNIKPLSRIGIFLFADSSLIIFAPYLLLFVDVFNAHLRVLEKISFKVFCLQNLWKAPLHYLVIVQILSGLSVEECYIF